MMSITTTMLLTFSMQIGCSTPADKEPSPVITDTDQDEHDDAVETTDTGKQDMANSDSGLVDLDTGDSEGSDTGLTDTEDMNTMPAYECGDEMLYDPTPIGSWQVCLSKALHLNQPTVAADAIALLTSDLATIESLLSPPIVIHLQAVKIWLEEDIAAFPGAVYHPSSGWLVNNGYPEYWAMSIQIGNANDYLNWTNIQPAMILHELSHAWHHQILGYGQTEIGNAYNAAVASGIYDSVEYAGGGMQPAYALHNKQEYFAELTEAYFWENDFYPFTRSQLETFDPQGFTALENAWVIPE